MFVKNIFKGYIKKSSVSLRSCLEGTTSRILKKTCAHLTLMFTITSLFMILLSGCSTIGQKVASAADALKTDVQTQHDENFRMRRVRKALLIGNISEAEEQRDTLHAPHWRCVANIEIAAAKYPMQKTEALEAVKKTTEDIWNISDANKRARALLALLKFELETKKDLPQAKETIKQTEKTIAFILDDHSRKMRRYGELQNLLEKHNHLLSR